MSPGNPAFPSPTWQLKGQRGPPYISYISYLFHMAWEFQPSHRRPSYKCLVVFVVATVDFIGSLVPLQGRMRELLWALSPQGRIICFDNVWKPEWAKVEGYRAWPESRSSVYCMDYVSSRRWAKTQCGVRLCRLLNTLLRSVSFPITRT